MATSGTPTPAEGGPRRLWLIAVLFGLVSSAVLCATVVLVTRSSGTRTASAVSGDPPATQVTRAEVVLIGDSITEQSQETFREVVGGRWQLWIDGRSGATVAQQMPAAEQAVGEYPAQVVVNLGTNDLWWGLDPAVSVAQVREMLDLFPGATCLHVVTIHEGIDRDGHVPGPAAVDFNDRLRRLAAADPRVSVIEWDAQLAAAQASGARPTDLLVDTVHPTERGERLLAESYASALGACPA